MTVVVKGEESIQVPHAVDVAGWLRIGYMVEGTEKPETKPSTRGRKPKKDTTEGGE